MTAGRVLVAEEGGVGGVADYSAALCAALGRAGWQVELVTARDHGFEPMRNVTAHRVFPYVRGRTAFGRAIRRARLSKPINGLTHLAANAPLLAIARRCDVVHVQGGEWPPLGALQAFLVAAARRPLVWTPHNTFDRGVAAYARSRALTVRRAARVIVHSEHDRAGLEGPAAAKTVVVPHGEYGGLARRGAPDADPAAARAALGIPPDATVALMFGQLRPDKGIVDLLAAAAEVEGLHVVLAGEDKGALAESAALLADPRLAGRVVVREGFVPPPQVGPLFAAADVVALPYRVASASGVLLLAYGYARPVIAYPVGGLPEYVEEGVSGWVCAAPEPAALAARLREAAALGRDGCLRLGAAAKALADDRYSWDAIAARTISLYREVLGGRYHPRSAR